jgi:hypothetical protein
MYALQEQMKLRRHIVANPQHPLQLEGPITLARVEVDVEETYLVHCVVPFALLLVPVLRVLW